MEEKQSIESISKALIAGDENALDKYIVQIEKTFRAKSITCMFMQHQVPFEAVTNILKQAKIDFVMTVGRVDNIEQDNPYSLTGKGFKATVISYQIKIVYDPFNKLLAIDDLKKRLKIAVSTEKYEEAAAIKKQIDKSVIGFNTDALIVDSEHE